MRIMTLIDEGDKIRIINHEGEEITYVMIKNKKLSIEDPIIQKILKEIFNKDEKKYR